MMSVFQGLSASIILLLLYQKNKNKINCAQIQQMKICKIKFVYLIIINNNLQQFMKTTSTFEEDIQTFEEEKIQPEKSYGNLIVFSKRIVHISIGPDYLFTITGLVFQTIISYFLYKFGQSQSLSTIGSIVNLIIVALPPSSFIYTALSNPGIYNESQNDKPKVRYCQYCKVFKPNSVHHCLRCHVCIEGYDHHCPWISKCVGSKNLTAFYVFLLSMPTLFIYFGFLIYRAITNNPQK